MKHWSRKKKLLLCIPILLISLFFIASISQWGSPTPEIALRRMEKRQLIGPSEIIAAIDTNNVDNCHMILGESEYGYTVFLYFDSVDLDSGNLYYFPKAEQVTICCTGYNNVYGDGGKELPIYVFPENTLYPEAWISLTISGGEETHTYEMVGHLMDSTFYCFPIQITDMPIEDYYLLNHALNQEYDNIILSGTVEIQIDFYDHSGNLLDTYSKTVTK